MGSRIRRLPHRIPTRTNNKTETAVTPATDAAFSNTDVTNGVIDRNLGEFAEQSEDERAGKDVLRKAILELVKKGYLHHTDIEKKACATCLSFATTNTIRKQFCHHLLPNGYIERTSRGMYNITKKGEKLVEILL